MPSNINDIFLDKLHDFVLKSLNFNWEIACLNLNIQSSESNQLLLITFKNVSYLNINQLNEWGKSVYINDFIDKKINESKRQFTLNMQSGDKLNVIYETFDFNL